MPDLNANRSTGEKIIEVPRGSMCIEVADMASSGMKYV